MTADTRKIFTLEQANRTLPFVRRVVRDIVESHQQISDLYGQWRRQTDDGQSARADELESEIRGLLETRDEYVRELGQIGCESKEMKTGLVDFPAMIGDRLVYLCWRPGEPELLYWHEIDEGYAGRRPVDGFFTCAGSTGCGPAQERGN